jgi:L-rhamnose-H+ transport protein
MNLNILQAVALIVGASAINAAYVLPMRLNRKWAWENSWLAFSVLGVGVVPTLIAVATIPDLWSIYGAIPISTLTSMAVFGILWGICLVLFGLAIPMVGLAVTNAVSLGTSAACGSLLPLLMQHPDRIFTSAGLFLALGVGLIITGVAFCGVAGRARERLEAVNVSQPQTGFYKGFVYALLSGILGSMLNLGLAMGGDIQRMAYERGSGQAMMSNAVWLPCLYAGLLPGVIYCLYLMKRNGTTRLLLGAARWYYWLMGALMGALWFGSIIAYSFATVKLGELGPVVGWPLFMSCVVIAAMVTGLVAGEWSRTGARPVRLMGAGVVCLVAAIAVLSFAAR